MTTPARDVQSKSAFLFHSRAHRLNFRWAGRALPGWQGLVERLPNMMTSLLWVLLSWGMLPAEAASIGAPAPEVRGKV